jgi:hypothetical protein
LIFFGLHGAGEEMIVSGLSTRRFSSGARFPKEKLACVLKEEKPLREAQRAAEKLALNPRRKFSNLTQGFKKVPTARAAQSSETQSDSRLRQSFNRVGRDIVAFISPFVGSYF